MSRLFGSLLNSLRSPKKAPEKARMADSCYMLYIHYGEMTDIGDDPPEPAAFQIPVEMKWKDLQDLICTEVGSAAKTGFTYIDDERDIVRIDSQEEYETAIEICRRDNRDLHIYSTMTMERKNRRFERRSSIEKKKPEEFTVLPEQDKQDENEIVRPPTPEEEEKKSSIATGTNLQMDEEQPETSEVEPAFSSTEEAASAPTEEDVVISSIETNDEETVPMPIGNSILRIIKKEVHEVITEELDDVWRYVNALKRDINAELDVIGEQLATHSAQLPEVQKQIRDQLKQKTEELSKEPEPSDSEKSIEPELEEDEANNFAATFICENLLDGSIVHTGETFEKYWVFRNDGSVRWNENTKLHLLDESCEPPVATGSSISQWGAKNKSANMPPLKQGESGVVCAPHVAPDHRCDHNSSWRLSHKNNPFGPRVWCSVSVIEEVGTPVDREAQSLGSYVEVKGERSPKKSLETKESVDDDLHGSLVPQSKLQVEAQSPKQDDGLHNDNSIMSFNMDDISDGAKYIESSGHDSVPYNPAVTSVEDQNKEDEPLHTSLEGNENEGASVDGEEHSRSSESPVMVSPSTTEDMLQEPNQDEMEEPRTLENDDSEDEDLYSSKYVQNEDHKPEDVVDNFTEQVVRTPDPESSSEEEEEEEEEEVKEVEEPAGAEDHAGGSEDLHSVDYNLDDDNVSMTSYDVSDFVVVPLPECFDVNKPLNASQYEDKKEDEPEPTVDEEQESEDPSQAENPPQEKEEDDPTSRYPPEEEESSDSEVDSQPSSTRIKEYRSEDSSIHLAPKSLPKMVTPPQSLTQKVNLAPAFVPPQKEPPSGGEASQPDSLDESLTEKITKEFEAFLSNPDSPINPPQKTKLTMNEMTSTIPKVTAYQPEPKPVPQSVLNMDTPYHFEQPNPAPYFPPFEQGWRRNPLPVPPSVTNDDPWQLGDPTLAPRLPPRLPESEFTLNQNSSGIESTLPSHPFAIASPSGSLHIPGLIANPPRQQRSPSPDIEMADDFYPPGYEPAGSNFHNQDLEDNEIFRTPPPSPPPFGAVELSPLDQLYEMGFHDLELNKKTYDQCGQDLNRTVQALIFRAEADQEMMA